MVQQKQIDFEKLGGLVPCIVQDADSHVVLMLGFMNAEALEKTIAEKRVTFSAAANNVCGRKARHPETF